MSFILDALRKSDKKRQETAAPKLDTVHAVPPSGASKKPLWIALLVVGLLLNLGLLGWFLLRLPEPASVIVPHQSRTETTAAVQSGEPLPSVPGAGTTTPQMTGPQTIKEADGQSQTAQALSKQVYSLSELPTAVQRRIPPLHMSLHAYNKANPAAGMVRVNDQILRPGARLDDKYLLEEINVSGAVFSFEGYRFLLPRD